MFSNCVEKYSDRLLLCYLSPHVLSVHVHFIYITQYHKSASGGLYNLYSNTFCPFRPSLRIRKKLLPKNPPGRATEEGSLSMVRHAVDDVQNNEHNKITM